MKKKQHIDYSKMSIKELVEMAKRELNRINIRETEQKKYTKERNSEYNNLSSIGQLKPMDVQKINTVDDLWKMLGYLGTFPTECVAVISCKTDNTVCDIFTCTQNSNPDSVTTDPDYIAKRAKEHNADYIYMAHNHPSGILKESTEDVWLTKITKSVCGLSNIRVKDHFIVTLKNLYSIEQKKVVY